jgi:hypothetical protein
MRLSRKILLGLGAATTSMFVAAPAHAYYIIYSYYYGPGGGIVVSGAQEYCDDGTLYASGGLITMQQSAPEYHTGQPPC